MYTKFRMSCLRIKVQKMPPIKISTCAMWSTLNVKYDLLKDNAQLSIKPWNSLKRLAMTQGQLN